jgi:hypothetical protein
MSIAVITVLPGLPEMLEKKEAAWLLISLLKKQNETFMMEDYGLLKLQRFLCFKIIQKISRFMQNSITYSCIRNLRHQFSQEFL